MVQEQIALRGVEDPDVLAAMRTVPRHAFVPEGSRRAAYEDRPLPIGEGQTISQPYIVARMTELADLDGEDRVFELGTGSGYQAAVASRIAAHVFTVEIEPTLAEHARQALERQGYDNVTVRVGDGSRGWPGQAPFDAVLVTAAFPEIPPALIDQLAPGGRAVLPVGPAGGTQELVVVEKDETGQIRRRTIFPVRFVPGRHEP